VDAAVRDCACGSPVVADPAAPRDGVMAHNRSPEHRKWRRNREKVLATWFRRRAMRWKLELLYCRRRWPSEGC
jgi:hypothetical protein